MTPTASSTANIGAARSPHPSSNHSFLSELSRDRSNSNHAATGNKKPRVLLPPANNKRIHDFFSTSKKKPLHHQAAKATGTGTNSLAFKNASVGQPQNTTHTTNIIQNSNNYNNNNNQSIGDSHAKEAKGSSIATSTTATTRTAAISSLASSATLLAAKAATEEWQAKCAKLQQTLHDKDEQLKAVTGNKTILHTALQQALTKTRKELQGLMDSTASKTQKVNSVLEETLRWKFERQAKELRATLSADGNRLGRIVSTRAGMRVIDTWEEGFASRDWQVRKEEWKSKHRALLEKQERLKQQLQNQQQSKNTDTTIGNSADSNDSTNATTILSPLEVQEAQESIQMHMEALLREEKELLAEEQTLNDEKGAHIRALKRVASEDASRFKNRTKLHDRYVLDCLLGKGGFSEVWKGYDLRELKEVAVKIHQLDPRWPDSKKENYTKHVSREYEIHRQVRHSRIVSLFDVFEIDNNSFATVLECCKGTDLDTLLKRKKRLPERQARAILLQILTGMQYLSQPSASGSRQGIIHYDLKPGNILFDVFGDAKITDFGLSKIVDTPDPAESMELTSQGAGTYWYLPPECFVTGEQVRISNKVDVWSIGVIFYQMLYGKRPFGEGKSQDKLLADHTMLNAQEVHMPEKPAISEAGKEFIKQCLMYDQAFRPTIAQLCENPYALQKVP
jgi:tousled-like kinase